MTNIARYARCIERISLFLLPVPVLLLVFKWTYGVFNSNNPLHCFPDSDISFSMRTMPLVARIAGVCVDSLSVIIFLAGMYYIARIMRLFQQGETFSLATISLFKTISKLALANAIYSPLSVTLLTLIATLHNPSGQRYLVTGISGVDIVNIFLVGFFFIITSVMHEGYRLKIEQDLTV